jgi:glucose-6-phosphate 1-dehydrogenase
MIALATMDAPKSYKTEDIMAKRVEAIESLVPDPSSLVLGQYDGYLKEKDVSPLSVRDTYFAFKTHLNRTRFAGIPIYVRGGKQLSRTATEISIVFKNSTERVLSHLPGGANPNVLIYRLQPNEGIVLKMLTKVPGHELKVEESYMQYCYPRDKDLPDAYERLIIDAIHGDQTFFNDSREVEAQWRFTDVLYTAVTGTPELYEKGSWGPTVADAMIQKDGRSWLEPSVAFCNY